MNEAEKTKPKPETSLLRKTAIGAGRIAALAVLGVGAYNVLPIANVMHEFTHPSLSVQPAQEQPNISQELTAGNQIKISVGEPDMATDHLRSIADSPAAQVAIK